ncbi:hypothetical protein R3P38DRAFT_3431890 [Favolaschia claudopus]|uniref:Uncharacterized protein n=1 Tax=Favolaschia claudopus TaxID=2862362 RepID=A0AAW0CZ52_9AGAR
MKAFILRFFAWSPFSTTMSTIDEKKLGCLAVHFPSSKPVPSSQPLLRFLGYSNFCGLHNLEVVVHNTLMRFTGECRPRTELWAKYSQLGFASDKLSGVQIPLTRTLSHLKVLWVGEFTTLLTGAASTVLAIQLLLCFTAEKNIIHASFFSTSPDSGQPLKKSGRQLFQYSSPAENIRLSVYSTVPKFALVQFPSHPLMASLPFSSSSIYLEIFCRFNEQIRVTMTRGASILTTFAPQERSVYQQHTRSGGSDTEELQVYRLEQLQAQLFDSATKKNGAQTQQLLKVNTISNCGILRKSPGSMVGPWLKRFKLRLIF